MRDSTNWTTYGNDRSTYCAFSGLPRQRNLESMEHRSRKKLRMRRVGTLVAAAVLPITIVAGGSSAPVAAVASARAPFDIVIQAKDFHIKSGGCQDVPFKVRHSAGYLDRFTAEVEVWKGPRFVDRTFNYVYDSSGPLRDSFFVCISERDDLGTYRLGPSRGEYNDYDANVDGRWSDRSQVRIKVLQHSRFQRIRATERAGVHTFTGRLSYFDAGGETYRPAPRGTSVRLQRQRPGGVWVDVETTKVGRAGSVHVRTRNKRAAIYRFAFSGTAITWHARSAEIKS